MIRLEGVRPQLPLSGNYVEESTDGANFTQPTGVPSTPAVRTRTRTRTRSRGRRDPEPARPWCRAASCRSPREARFGDFLRPSGHGVSYPVSLPVEIPRQRFSRSLALCADEILPRAKPTETSFVSRST